MIDTLDLIDTYAAAGYAWLAKSLPLLQAEVWFIGTLVLAGTVWALVRELPGALEGRGDPLWGLVRYWFAAFTGVVFLHVTVAGPIGEFAPRLHANFANALGGSGRLTLPAYATEVLARDAVTVALRITNPDRQQLVQVPAAQVAAQRVIESSLASADPQYNANRAVWSEVVAPAYLDASPALRDALLAAGLMYAFLAPPSDLHDTATVAQQARRVRQIIDQAQPPPLSRIVPALQPLIAERLGGELGWTPDGSEVEVRTVGDLTRNAMQALPAAPAQINARADARDAFDRGRATLTAVVTDARRLEPQRFAELGALYTALGRGGDAAAAAGVLRDPLATMWFGATCQRDQALCVRALVDAQAAQQLEARGGERNATARSVADAAGFVVTLAGRLLATVMEGIISSVMPASIGYAKAIIVLLSPLALLLMLWPGRFTLALQLIVGGHVFIALWTMLYVVWDRFTGAQLNAVSGFRSLVDNAAPASLLATNLAQMLIVAGYFGLTAVAWAVTMQATNALGRAASAAAGAGAARMQEAGAHAARQINRHGTGITRPAARPRLSVTASGGSDPRQGRLL